MCTFIIFGKVYRQVSNKTCKLLNHWCKETGKHKEKTQVYPVKNFLTNYFFRWTRDT
jgi:hypothetical protein